MCKTKSQANLNPYENFPQFCFTPQGGEEIYNLVIGEVFKRGLVNHANLASGYTDVVMHLTDLYVTDRSCKHLEVCVSLETLMLTSLAERCELRFVVGRDELTKCDLGQAEDLNIVVRMNAFDNGYRTKIHSLYPETRVTGSPTTSILRATSEIRWCAVRDAELTNCYSGSYVISNFGSLSSVTHDGITCITIRESGGLDRSLNLFTFVDNRGSVLKRLLVKVDLNGASVRYHELYECGTGNMIGEEITSSGVCFQSEYSHVFAPKVGNSGFLMGQYFSAIAAAGPKLYMPDGQILAIAMREFMMVTYFRRYEESPVFIRLLNYLIKQVSAV